jgi:serine/threonine protein kinase
MKQVLSAVDFCHRKQIAHRTLGPDNILLIQNHSMFIVKLIDFSQACALDCPKPKSIL